MDPFDLARFRVAQDRAFDAAREELRRGAKCSHWMWFMFPQMRGLGSSETARVYGVGSRAEAEAYLADPVLRARLVELCELALSHDKLSAHDIFGSPDDLKLRSCATLFGEISPEPFARVLDRFFGGERDPRTLALLAESA